MKVDTLRLRLPSIHDLTSTAVTAFAYKQAGVWHVGEPTSLTTILSQYQPRLLEVGLHPADTTLVTTSMPPLSEKHRRTAVLAQIEPLALDDVDQLSIAYGPRSPSGDVTLAWLPRESLAYVHDVLQGQGVVLPTLRFYPAPFFLALSDTGQTSTLIDQWTVVRKGSDSGFIQPVSFNDGAAANPQTKAPDQNSADMLWAGQVPSWFLAFQSAQAGAVQGRKGWGIAGITAVLAALIWLIGLNVYASRLAEQGTQLQTQMRARVKSVFPEIPIVMNPLQQAKQQRDLRLSGLSDAQSPPFQHMLRVSAKLLNELTGQVELLRYYNGKLHIELRGGSLPSDERLGALAQQADAAGLIIESSPSGWVVSAHADTDTNPDPGTATVSSATSGGRG